MRAAIEQAAKRIDGHVRVTPILRAGAALQDSPGVDLTLKLELHQHAGSFKPRGAFNRMLSADIPAAGVIAASGGNHGAAVAYAARQLGVRAEVFVPQTTPAAKVARLRDYGATIHQVGANYAEAFTRMQARAAQTGALVVHAYDQEEVVAGQGTLARELQAQAGDVDAVLVAVGGGGLIGGVAGWYGNDVDVIAVEPNGCATLHGALAAGEQVDVSVSGVAADSLGARRIGDIAFGVARQYVRSVVLVSDEEILQARRWLWERFRILPEPGGAAAMAGLLCGRSGLQAGRRVAVIVCGGNSDPGTI